MEDEKDERIGMRIFGYTSEWALAKYFPAIFRDEVSRFFNLIGVCGREENEEMAINRLEALKKDREMAIQQGAVWRFGNVVAEWNSCRDLRDRIEDERLKKILGNNPLTKMLSNERLQYNCVRGVQKDFDNLSDNYAAAVIFTKNPVHIDYLEQLIKKRKHIVCEKPLVVVTDENHMADRSQLNRLEDLVRENGELILMDAEHYSAKEATLIFYERISDMLANHGKISKIEGYTFEKDKPDKPRTKTLLSRNNRTGLLLDMGVHLIGIISNIEGNVGEIKSANYGIYRNDNLEYDVETCVDISMGLEGRFFHDDASADFTFVKFTDKMEPDVKGEYEKKYGLIDLEHKDSKQYKITFKEDEENGKETVVTLDFSKGTVVDSNGKVWKSLMNNFSSNEYENIMRQFYMAIKSGNEPRTSFKRSIKTLEAIHRIYEIFPVFNEDGNSVNCRKVYVK